MKHKPYIVIFVILSIMVTISYCYVLKISVNPKISNDFKNDIERKIHSTIEIKKIDQSQNEYFVLFEDYDKKQISIIYYVPHLIFRNRYVIFEDPNNKMKFFQDYGYEIYGLGWPEDGIYKTLYIIYGDNKSGIAKSYNLKFNREVFGDNIKKGFSIEEKIKNGYFIDVYRYKQKGLDDLPKLEFYDKNGNPMILK